MSSLDTLEAIKAKLLKADESAESKARKGDFESATDKLALAIGQAKRDLHLAEQQKVRESRNFESASLPAENDPQAKLTEERLQKEVQQLIARLEEKNSTCILQFTNKKVDEEVKKNKLKEEKIAKKGEEESKYAQSLEKLEALKQQAPRAGVEDELNNLVYTVKSLKHDNKVKTPELTHAMDLAYDRLTNQCSKEKYTEETNRIYNKGSLGMKILGASLVALGLALAASGIFFAPAVILSTATLGTIYPYALGTATASAALSAAGGFCFFKDTSRMKVAQALRPLVNLGPEEQSYGSEESIAPMSV